MIDTVLSPPRKSKEITLEEAGRIIAGDQTSRYGNRPLLDGGVGGGAAIPMETS